MKLFLTAFPKPIKLLFTEPIIMVISIYLLVIYAILYMDFEEYSFLFANSYYNFNLVQIGLAFLPSTYNRAFLTYKFKQVLL